MILIVKLTKSPTKTFPLASDVLTTVRLATGFTVVFVEVTFIGVVEFVVTQIVLLYLPSLVALKTNLRVMVSKGPKTLLFPV